MRTLAARRITAVWLIALISALGVGHFGTWLWDFVRGNTVTATVNSCHLQYGWNETPYAQCIGDWHHSTDLGGGNVSTVASGPILGVDVDPLAKTTTEDGKLSGDYAGDYFARLNSGGAVVIPGWHLILGPLFLLTMAVSGGLVLLQLRRTHK